VKRILILATIVLFNLHILSASEGIRVQESLSFFSKILKQEVKYSVCLPTCYFNSKKSYPVVYLLHGLGDDESSWLEYGNICQVSDKEVKSGNAVPMIFIMPQGFRNYYVNDYAGTFLYQDMFVNELVPLIDSLYRTIPDKQHRATIGFSMGGFGALILPLKHPEMFSVCVPLSISVRTDEQYEKEDAFEWNDQWGRLFGGVGKNGPERITEFYRNNSPFHIIETADLGKYKDLKIFIVNGDDENTLCRSNEELHILMRNISFPHEFRVRDGGHEFDFWRQALPDGLHFISDAFEGKVYRGDSKTLNQPKKVNPAKTSEKETYSIIFPDEYKFTSREYPVIYFMGNFSTEEKEKMGGMISKWTSSGSLSPMILTFLNVRVSKGEMEKIFSEMETNYRARKGYRFRAVISYGNFGNDALRLSMDSLIFTSCAIIDGNPEFAYATNMLKSNDLKTLKRTWYYVDYPDKGLYFAENGFLHILFRESDLYHEYRVREGNGGVNWFLSGLQDALTFTQEKIHK
jgi:enterochelin esterase-like enzyme